MFKSTVTVLFFVTFIIISCGDSDNKGGNAPGLKSKAGWTNELIDTLIACQPNPSDTCNCVIPKVTEKYTPEQVREKSPLVAADMLIIKTNCEASDKGNTSQPAPPSQGQSEIVIPSLKGDNCETGEHKYKNLTEVCQGLQSDFKNNNCALDQRITIFRELHCPGTFQQQP